MQNGETDICHNCRKEISPHPGSTVKLPYLAKWLALWYYEDNVRRSLLRFKFYNARSYAKVYGRILAMRLQQEQVDFDTFCKSDFRAVKVKDCQAVKKSDKLLQFTLDDGTGTDRQILSGIAKYYKPEELIGKTLVAITNLPPRKMMGKDSCGILLSAATGFGPGMPKRRAPTGISPVTCWA